MNKTILTEQDYIRFYKAVTFGNTDQPIVAAVKAAYRDLCRTITGFSKHPDHSSIYKNAVKLLCDDISTLLKNNITTQQEFDMWHKNCCDKLLSVFATQPFHYGQAQKWINMSLKDLSMIDHSMVENHYRFFHVPIDNFIMNITEIRLPAVWSRIADYDEYMCFQKLFREKYHGIPLDEEFHLWLDAKKDQ